MASHAPARRAKTALSAAVSEEEIVRIKIVRRNIAQEDRIAAPGVDQQVWPESRGDRENIGQGSEGADAAQVDPFERIERVEIADRVAPVACNENEAVRAAATVEQIVARTAQKTVGLGSAPERIRPGPSVEQVASPSPAEPAPALSASVR